MRRALIEPSGRVAQVEDVDFPIAAPLRWVDCDDDATPATHHFDGQAVVEIPPPPPPSHNEQIEQQIAEIYNEAPFDQRGLTELAYGLCQVVDILRAQNEALVAVIREIGGPSFADFDIPRIPDLKKNKGMVNAKSQIDRTNALRRQKQ